MNKKKMQEQLARLSLDMHAIVDKAKAENNRGLTSEEREKFHNLETEFSGVEASIKIADRMEAIDADLRSVPADRIAAEIEAAGDVAGKRKGDPKHAKAFSAFLRNGMEGLDADQRTLMASKLISISNAAQTTATGSSGGYLIPQGFSDQLEEAMKWFGGILGNVGTFDTETGNPLPWPTDNDTAQMGRLLTENTQLTQTGITFGQVTFNAYIFTTDIVLVPLTLMQDSYFDMDAYIARKMGERIGRLFNHTMTVGTGSSQPTGIQTAAVAAGNTTQGATGETTSLIYADLVNTEHLVDPAYRPASKWMFHDSTLKVLKKLVDGENRPLWQPALTASFGQGAMPMILDHPYVINNDMPVMAASAYPILFGDLTKYKVRRVAGGTSIMRLVERYADYLQIGFLGFLRADGQLLDAGTHPIAAFQNAAS